MEFKPADRISAVSEYYFSRKLKEVAQLNAEGKDIISLAIGSPTCRLHQPQYKHCAITRRKPMHTATNPL